MSKMGQRNVEQRRKKTFTKTKVLGLPMLMWLIIIAGSFTVLGVYVLVGEVLIYSTPLAEDFNDISVSVTSTTTGVISERDFCKINTLKKSYKVFFRLDNDMSELIKYFENVTVTIKLAGSQCTTVFDGKNITEGSITVGSGSESSEARIIIAYATTDTTGDIHLKIAIRAEEIS